MSATLTADAVLVDDPDELDELDEPQDEVAGAAERDAFDGHYEVVDGVKVELPPMATDSAGIAGKLARWLGHFAEQADLGEVYPEMLFRLPQPGDPGRNRKPDVAFVPYTQWAKGRRLPRTNAWDVVPDLCVEVVSPSDIAEDVRGKTREYFRAGVRLVWVVYPSLDLVDVYDSSAACRTLERADALDGGAVLPGFKVELAALFPEPAAEVTP